MKNVCTRDRIIDRFRGLAIILIILTEIWDGFNSLGFLSRLASHKASNGIQLIEGLQFADILAPMFLFAVGLTYKLSYNKRKKTLGCIKAKQQFVMRYIYLIAIGGILRGCESIFYYINYGYVEHAIDYFFFLGIGVLILVVALFPFLSNKNTPTSIRIHRNLLIGTMSFIAILCVISTSHDLFCQIIFRSHIDFKVWGYWEALQAIGAAGIITLFFIDFSTIKRFVVASLIFVIYTIFHQSGNFSQLISIYAQQGGLGGVMGQSCILLYGTVLSDLYHSDKERLEKYFLVLPWFGIMAVIFLQYIPPTMRSVSPSYILLNIFISGTIFVVLWIYRFINFKFDLLAIFGKNSLVMYILQYIVIYIFKLLIGDDVLKMATIPFALLVSFFMFLILAIVAFLLDKKGIIIKI